MKEKALAMAAEHGWNVHRPGSNSVEFVKPVPMIEQRDENHVCAIFDDDGGLTAAFYGPDRRPHPLTDLLGHLAAKGRR